MGRGGERPYKNTLVKESVKGSRREKKEKEGRREGERAAQSLQLIYFRAKVPANLGLLKRSF